MAYNISQKIQEYIHKKLYKASNLKQNVTQVQEIYYNDLVYETMHYHFLYRSAVDFEHDVELIVDDIPIGNKMNRVNENLQVKIFQGRFYTSVFFNCPVQDEYIYILNLNNSNSYT